MSVAKAYAQALYQATAEHTKDPAATQRLETELDSLTQILDNNKVARSAFYGPVLSAKEKTTAVEGIAQKLNLSAPLVQFLSLLARKGRFSLLPEIRDSFHSVRLSAEGGVLGYVVSAEPVGDEDIQSLAQAFSRKLGKKVAFRVSTDSALLAGMKVTVNGVTYDGSLKSQLQKLRDQVIQGMAKA